MSSFRSLILHPLLSIGLWVEDDNGEGGIDIVYLLTGFFAIGIWLVVNRYQNKINGAVDFFVDPPDVCESLVRYCFSDFFDPTGCRPQLAFRSNPEPETDVPS
jgi:hypothetical protein